MQNVQKVSLFKGSEPLSDLPKVASSIQASGDKASLIDIQVHSCNQQGTFETTKSGVMLYSERQEENVIPVTLLLGVRSCRTSPFSRCTPILDWSE